MDDGSADENISIRITSSTRFVDVFVPLSDIDSCIQFSLFRCVLTILSIVLVVTDIPRTGLGLRSMSDSFRPVAPDTVMYFGPYAYQVAHIRKDDFESESESNTWSSYSGTCEGQAIDAVDLWSYKFDSLSIPTRALAERLNVSAYPPCVLYREACISDTLSLLTVFAMLDGVITAVTACLQPEPAVDDQSIHHATPRLQFATRSLWIDRLHHFLVKLVSQHSELRAHAVQYFSSTSEQLRTNICDPGSSSGSLVSATARPDICHHPIVWLCDHPLLGASVQVPLWSHLALRVFTLRRQYPDLSFDLTLLSTQMPVTSRRWLLPAFSYSLDNIEITTLIRGRRCDDDRSLDTSSRNCTTVVIDDYRYERSTVESDASQWFAVTSFLRGAGQTYMCLRILCLLVGCYKARSAESKFKFADWQTRTQCALLTLVKIPSHVVVYGSWVPVTCYALAHYVDCSWIHLLNDTAWSTINGSVDFDPVQYFVVASIQMRNIWLVSLMLKAMALGHHYFLKARAKHWTPADGIVGVQGVLIGGISILTIFGPLRARVFRDASIVSFQVLTELHGRIGEGFDNPAGYGFRFDVKVLAIAVVVVFIAAQVIHVVVPQIASKTNIAVASRSYFVPFSANTLWSKGSLVTYWRVRSDLFSATPGPALRHIVSSQIPHLEPRQRKSRLMTWLHRKIVPFERLTSASNLVFSRTFRIPTLQPAELCAVCIAKLQRGATSRWLLEQGCPNHDTLVHLEQRTKEHWSIARLKNIAMMTDPMVLLRLYVAGRQLYIYRVKIRSSSLEPIVRQAVVGDARARSQSIKPVPETRSVGEGGELDELEPLPSHARLYVLPCPLCEILECFDSFPETCEDIVSRYELVATTISYSLPWTVLVNCG